MATSLDDLKYFITISETLNVTRASERAGVSQPTMSYAIQRLEKELGGKLLIRLKNGVQLTKFGKDLTSQARKIILEWEKARLLTSGDSFNGKYTLGVHPSVALYTLEHFIMSLKEDYPQIAFRLSHDLSRKITEKVINWELDFGIVVNPVKHPDLIIKELCQDKVSLFGATKKNSILVYDDNLNQTDYVLKKIRSQYTFETDLTSDNLEVVAKLAAIGYGAGILPERVANQYENLKCLTPEIYFKDRICLIYRHEKHQDPTSKKVIEYIVNSSY